MIKINLLPDGVKGRQRKGGGKQAPGVSISAGDITPIVYVILAVMAVIIIGIGYFSLSSVISVKKELKVNNKTLAALEKENGDKWDDFQSLRQSESIYNVQKNVIDLLLPPKPLLWAEKINQIAILIPHKVYLTKITMREIVDEKETAESKEAKKAWEKGGKKGDKPAVVKIPTINHELLINGVAVAKESDEGLKLMLEFIDKLKTFKSPKDKRNFGEHFNEDVTINANTMTTYYGVSVNSFALKLTSKDIIIKK